MNIRGVRVACGEACGRWCGSGLESVVEQVEAEAASCRPRARSLSPSLCSRSLTPPPRVPEAKLLAWRRLGWIKRSCSARSRHVHLRSRAELVHLMLLALSWRLLVCRCLSVLCIIVKSYASRAPLQPPRSRYEAHNRLTYGYAYLICTALPRVAWRPSHQCGKQTKQHVHPHPAKATGRKVGVSPVHNRVVPETTSDLPDRRRNTALQND